MELTAFMKIFIDDRIKKNKNSLKVLPNLQVQIYGFRCQSIGFPTKNKTDGRLFQKPSQNVLDKLKYKNYLLCEPCTIYNIQIT